MSIVLTCHLIETIWSRKDIGMRAPYMVIDHNGQQHQTEVMKAGAVTVWNTKVTFPYAPSSDLVVMAFDAAGRQPGAFIAQAVVDIAAMLQQGSLNASAALVNKRGQSVGVVLFDVGLVTSSKALAAGLDIPSLTFSTQPCPDSPTAQLTRSASPTQAAAANGRNSPFAQLSVQRNLAQGGSEMQPGTPGTAQSISQKLMGSISQALVGALLGLETRDREETQQQAGSFGLRSSSISPRRMGPVNRSLDCSPTRQAAQQQQQQQQQRSRAEVQQAPGQNGAAAAAAAAGSSVSATNGPLLSRRSLIQQTHADSVEQPPSPPSALARSSTTASGTASAPPMGTLSSNRASFSAWRQSGTTAAPLTASRPGAASSSNSPSTSTQGSPKASPTHRPTEADSCRPSQLSIPQTAPLGDTSNSSSTSPNPGRGSNLSPLTEARSRLRLQRPQPLPPLSQLFPPTQREGLIPVGRAPMSPGGYSQATTAGYSYLTSQLSNGMYQGPEASADYDALLREFDAADAAGKEAILFRELMVQQQERQAGTSHLLSMLSQQNQKEVLEHRQLMDALEGMASASPVTSPARAAADAFRSCFSSSTQITSGSSSNGGGSSDGSRGDTPFKHYPNLPEFATAAGTGGAAATAAVDAATASPQRKGKQHRGLIGSPAAASAVGSPSRPAAGGQLQQLSSAENDASPLYSARRGHKLLGDRVGQQGSVQSSPTAAAAAESTEDAAAVARQLNWQLLERMTQQEMAAAAAAAPVESYPISHADTEISDAVSDADAAQDASEAAATPKSMRQPPVPPAYTCKKSPGQLGAYCTTSSNSDQAAAKKSSSNGSSSSKSRWIAPARDVVPYPKPQPAFPAVAVTVEPTAPLMPVPEEYPSA